MKVDHGWNFLELYSIPVALRRWIINKTVDYVKRKMENDEKSRL